MLARPWTNRLTKPATRRARPALDPLEPREVPATLVVTTRADVVDPADHKLSLREAIDKANATPEADTIHLGAGVFNITRPGDDNDNTGGDFDVKAPITIAGAGPQLTVIDGQHASRLFDVIGPISATFVGVTLRNGGGANNGSGVQALSADLQFRNVVLSGHSSLKGGAINDESGDVTLTGSTVGGNFASGGGGGINLGTGQLTLTRSKVTGNTAGGNGGGIAAGADVGLTRSAVSENKATGLGGGIFAGTVTASRSTIGGNSSEAAGGGVTASTVTATRTTISGNTARLTGGGVTAGTAILTDSRVAANQAGTDGGGVSAGRVAVVRGTVTGNRAHGGGGLQAFGPVDLTDSVVSANTADEDGGGVLGDAVTVTGGHVSGNTSAGFGGGIRAATATVARATISDNSAAQGGGGLFASSAGIDASTLSGNAAAGGGGVEANGGLVMTNSTVSGNRASIAGGGILCVTATLANVTVTRNRSADGGGVFSGGAGPVILQNSIIAQNFVTAGGSNPDVSGTFVSNGHNLIGDPTGGTGFGGTTDLVGTAAKPLDPRLAPLTDNGGPTQTHALRADSPAIDRGGNTAVPAADQRGRKRVKDGNRDGKAVVDIGAFER